MKRKVAAGGLIMSFLFFLLAGPAHADRLDDLEKQIQNLEREVEELREERAKETEEQNRRIESIEETAASAEPYGATDLGGYMDLHYNDTVNGENSAKDEKLDFHRFVLYFGHELADWVHFHSELEFEHAFIEGGEESGEIELEQAYVDFLTGDRLNYRAGVLLVPAGIINLYHEPPTFNGVERPFVDTVIIPTTWSEAGAGVFGEPWPGVSYQLNVMGGLDAEEFSAGTGLRSGRQKAFETNAEDLAYTGRLEYKAWQGLSLGTSFFVGDSAQDLDVDADVGVTLLEADFRSSLGPLRFRGEIADVKIDDAAALNTVLGKTSGVDAIAEELFGWYLEGAYHFLPLLKPGTSHDAALFARYEEFDTQRRMPSGFDENPAFDRTAWTLGLTYWPIPDLALKVDYQDLSNEARTAEDLFNLGIGWQF